jgi:hypothetical protein
MSFTTYCVCLELRSLPSTGITRLQRYYEPLRHPKAPGLSLTGFRLVLADHTLGLPVLRALSLCTCCRHYPGAASGCTASLTSPSRISLPRKGRRVVLRIVLFEACSAFTRVTACTLAPSPIRDALSEGFSYFVTSIAAPVASGWSVCRVGLAHTGKRRLVTAHTHFGHQVADCGRMSRGKRQPLKRINRGASFIHNWTASSGVLPRPCVAKSQVQQIQASQAMTRCRFASVPLDCA